MGKNSWLFLVFFGSLFSSSVCSTSIVAWSFDHREGSKIIPYVYQAVGNYRSDLSPLGTDYEAILPSGMVKQSVYVDKKTFNLATGLQSNCLNDIDKCDENFFMSFFLKIENWDDSPNGVILRTTDIERTLPGIYVGKDDEKIIVSVKGSSGKAYSRTFPESAVWQKWGRVEIFFVGKLLLSVNGVDVTNNLKVVAKSPVDPMTTFDIVVGEESGPTFYLDEINVNFKEVGETYTTASGTEIQTTVPTTQPTTGNVEIQTAAQIQTTVPTTQPTTGDVGIQTTAYTTQSTAATTMKNEVHSTETTSTTASNTEIDVTEAIKPEITTAEHSVSSTEEVDATPIGPAPGADFSNIWIVIVIIGLALFLFVSCMVWLFCFRRRKKRSQYAVNQQIEMNGDYFRASTIVPYQDNPNTTDDNQTDNEGHNKPLIKEPETA